MKDDVKDRAALLLRLHASFTKHAGEEVTVEILKNGAYAFGSELATLRLFKAYSKCPPKKGVYQGYSVNMKTFYFTFNITC